MNKLITISKYMSGTVLFLILHLSLISLDYVLRIFRSNNQNDLIKFGINYSFYCGLLIIFFILSLLFLYLIKIRYINSVIIKIVIFSSNLIMIAIMYLIIQFWYVINTGIDTL